MKYIVFYAVSGLMGLKVNIWSALRDTGGSGSGIPPVTSALLEDRATNQLQDRAGGNLNTRVAS